MPRGSCQCGASFGGARTEHCCVCHHTFTGTSSGDRHRTGRHEVFEGPDRRRCLSVEEMLEKGMAQNKHGYWTTGSQDPRFCDSPSALETPGSNPGTSSTTVVRSERQGGDV